MKKNQRLLFWKDCCARIENSEKGGVFFRKLQNIKSLLSFGGDAMGVSESDIRAAVDAYLDMCAAEGIAQERAHNSGGKNMTVKDLLIGCDIQQASLVHYAFQEPPCCEDWEAFYQAHQSLIRDVATIEPVTGDYVVIGSTNFYDIDEPHKLEMYCKTELLSEFHRCSCLDRDKRAEDYSDEEIAQIAHEVLCFRFPNAYDMESMFWEELLGAEIFEGNVASVGRDVLAARVIQEMSFLGYSYEKTKQAQQRFWQRLEEAVKELDDEHQHYVTEEEMLAELAIDDDEPLPEEEAFDGEYVPFSFPEKSREVHVRNAIAQYRELLRYVEKRGVDE